MDWTWYLFRFDGRINRARFWLGVLVICLLVMICRADGGIAPRRPVRRHSDRSILGVDDVFKLVDPEPIGR